MSAKTTEEQEWLYDCIVQFLQSPRWINSITDFIDEFCVIFELEEENKLVYTEIHKNYVDLVDRLLEGYLAELGITAEEFVQVVVSGKSEKTSKLAFNQLLAVDDFLSFKRMMIKRNLELEMETVRALSGQGAAFAEAEDDEDELLREALRLSRESFAHEIASGASADPEIPASAMVDEKEIEELARLRELAELEHAIAISLSLEEERQLLLREAEEEEKRQLEAAQAASLAGSASVTAPTAVPSSAKAPPAAAMPTAVPVANSSLLPPTKPRGPVMAPLAEAEAKKLADLERLMLIKRQQELQKKQKEEEEKRRLEAEQKGASFEEEKKLREQHLKELRDKIKAQKKEERDKQMQAFEASNKTVSTPPPKKVEAAAPPGAPEKKPPGNSVEDDARMSMRIALARKFKQDILEEEAKRRGQ